MMYRNATPTASKFLRTNLPLLKRFGASVRRERVRLKMTQEQLAERLGFYPRTVQKIEAGTINVPLTTLARVQTALRCGWTELLGK